MTRRTARTKPVLASVLIAALVVVAVLLIERPAPSHAQANASNARPTWEYHTLNVEPESLQTRLNDLGKEGWEVFSIMRMDSKLHQDAGENRIRTTEVAVTARRRVTPAR